MPAPVIGITADLTRRKDGVHIGERQQYLNDCYVKAILAAGGTPIILPVITAENLIAGQMNIIDGLLLSGGGDINPLLFGEEPHTCLGSIDFERDAMETVLINMAIKKQLPILAICRGIQILSVVCGGTMYQHLPPDIFNVQHQQQTTGNFASHTISIKSGSKLASILTSIACGEKTVVNSFHHQAVKDVPDKFIVSAKSNDGVIEAIESLDEEQFIIGVQWHPERMIENNPAMLKLFKIFIEAAKNKKTIPKEV